MSDLKTAIINAKYIDLMDLAGSLVAEFGEATGEQGMASPEDQAMAAAIFRWAADRYEEAAE
ncbi:MAG: hypothetical protein CSA72_04550 [Rhodobacterales bacterium]|nr:MAG: hypothetical protein CSA72_04550 [Rhodobacterales bacterium]